MIQPNDYLDNIKLTKYLFCLIFNNLYSYILVWSLLMYRI